MTMWDTLAANHSVDATGRIITVTTNEYTNYCSQATGDKKTTGKWYFEVVLTAVGGWNGAVDVDSVSVGVTRVPTTTYPGQPENSYGFHALSMPDLNLSAETLNGNRKSPFGPNFGEVGTVLGVGLDLDGGHLYFSINGLWRRKSNTTYGSSVPDFVLDRAYSYIGGPIWPVVGAIYVGTTVTTNFAAADLIYDPPPGFAAWYEAIPVPVRALLVQPWAIKTGSELVQPWADAPTTRATLYQPWSDAPVVRALLKQPWSDALAARSLLVQPWAIAADARALLVQPWAITAEGVRAVLDQPWAIEDFNPVRALLDQPWSIAADDTVSRYTVSVVVGGQKVRPTLITIEGDLSEDSLSCELQLADEAEYARCRDGLALEVEIISNEATEHFAFVVTSARIVEEFGATQYVIEAMSATALFGPPYSEGLTTELSGMASAIAAGLIGPVDWQTVDWDLYGGVWSAAGETGLELLKQLAESVGGVVQSDPDGSIRVQSEYRIPVTQWATAAPDLILVENLDCFSVGSTFDPRSGRNRFLVGDQAISGDRTTPELTDISTGLKQARGYQVPWVGDLTLTHTGGDWASITAMGVEERMVTETVEIVSGSGQTQYPVYGEPAVVSWLQINLGTVTASEDGIISTQIPGESLVSLTYRTRCKLWLVRDAKAEQLQLLVNQ